MDLAPNQNSSNNSITLTLTQATQIIKQISSFPDCKNTSKLMYSNLMRRIKLLSPLFDELLDRDDQQLQLLTLDQLQPFQSLLNALISAKHLLKWILESSKLYQAVQREKISMKFLHITGQIEEALSKVSYHRLDLSEEILEQIGLVHAQLCRAKAKTESSDVQLEMDIAAVQEKPEPDAAILKRLSRNLHLLTTDDLRKESLAFHEMIITSSTDLGDSFAMISTLFKKLNDYLLTVNPEVDMYDIDKDTIKHRSPVIPDEFRCPISLELMRDPVIVSTGQTYERSCIQKWIDAGHKTCPKTQQTLLDTTVTPNYGLRSLITLWCETNGVELSRTQGARANRKTGNPASNYDKPDIGSLLKKLANGNVEEKRAAAGELRLLGKRNADNRVSIAEAGAIPLLVALLSSSDPRTQEHAVTALLNLSINDANKGIIVNAGAIRDIVNVLKNGSMEARENAAAALFSLSVVDENKVAIGLAGAIPALIDLLIQGTPRGKKDAATAIFNLSIYQGNKVRAVRAGIVDPLMRFIMEVDSGMFDEALAILAVLASHPEGKVSIGQAKPIPHLIELIRTGSLRNRENAAAILWSLCMGDLKHLKLAKELNAEQVLRELSDNGTDRAKRKASSLLEFLQRVEDTAD
ncbi:unnamed protein product [Amaranthus hypochondriacus]